MSALLGWGRFGDGMIKREVFASRSHAVEYALERSGEGMKGGERGVSKRGPRLDV